MMKHTLRAYAFIAAVVLFSNAASAQHADTLSLQDAVRMALASSPMTKAAEAGLDAARAHLKEIDSYIYPQLNADANYTRIDPVVTLDIPAGPNGATKSFSTMPNNNYNGNLNIQQLITAFGRERANERVAESGIQSAEDNITLARTGIAYQTVQAYYAVLTTDEALRVENGQLKVLEDNLKIAETREKQGVATSLDKLNIQVRISTVQSQISDLTSARIKQMAGLRRLTGIRGNVAVARPTNTQTLPEQLDSLSALAATQRAEIKVARDAENTARLQVEAVRRADNPLVTANVSGGVKDGYLPNLTDPKLNWAGTVALHVPLFDGGRNGAQVDQAQANLRAAEARREDAERGVTAEIEQALADVTASRSRLALLTSQIDQAQQAFSIARVRYENGAATNLDVLTAQQAVEQAQLQQAQLMFNYELSQYNLNRAVGTPLW
jgi:outer membrane protein